MTARPFYLPFQAAVKPTNVGAPSAKYYYYAAGTTTLQHIYTSSSMTVQLSNPLTANGAGQIPPVWLDDTLTWKVVIKDKLGATLWTRDNYVPGSAPDAADLAPYQAAAESAASASAASAVTAASGGTTATAQALIATGAATTAMTQAGIATAAATTSTTQAGISATAAAAASSSYNAIAAAIAPGALNNATLNASTKSLLKGLNTALGLPAYHDGSVWETVAYSGVSALVTADATAEAIYARSTYDTSKVWVRRYGITIRFDWFGGVIGYTGSAGANSTANNAAWAAMVSVLSALAVNAGGNSRGVPPYQYGTGTYEFSAPHDLNFGSVDIGGAGSGFAASTGAFGTTRLKFYDSTGIRSQSSNTTGASGTTSGAISGGPSTVHDLLIEGNFSGTEAEYHGIHARATIHCRNVAVTLFAGDAIRLDASTAGVLGNANSSTFYNCHGWASRNGMVFIGNNVGASKVDAGSFNNNRAFGIDSYAANIGSGFYMCEASNNGTVSNNDGVTIGASVVSNSGNRYFVISGKDVGATVTITIASPGVVTWNGHGFSNGDLVAFSTTGALPTGLSAATLYYVVNATTNTFQVSLTSGGTAINTSGTQSGVHAGLAPASTNAPSGTTADNAYWYYMLAGGVTSGIPAWNSGMLVRAGGAYRGGGSCKFDNCYAEVNNQGKVQTLASDLVVGGKAANWCAPSVSVVKGSGNQGAVTTNGAWEAVSGSVTARLGDINLNTLDAIFVASHSSYSTGTYRFRWDSSSLDLKFDNNGTTASTGFWITGTGTSAQFGTGAAVAHAFMAPNLMIGDGSATTAAKTNARRVTVDTAAPSTGAHGQGEFVHYRGSTAGRIGSICRVGGAAGTFVFDDLYCMTAAIGSPYTAWTGTASRATKDTSTATLADVAQTLKALIDDLKARGVI